MTAKCFIFFFLIKLSLFGRPIETFYGSVDVEEPVILELIDSAAFQRLNNIRQYGVSYYTTHKEEFTRYSHSLGVFHLLRASNRPLNEQIAGLLHDVSHTAFSHVGDWVFNKEYNDVDYQNSIHEEYLESSGLSNILRKHGFNPKMALPSEENAPALEQPRPNPSADRLDYSIQGAYHQKFITKEEAIEIFKDCHFKNNRWIASNSNLMKKVIKFALFMTEDCFGSPENHLSSRWLADAIIKGLETGLISNEEFHKGTDDIIWNRLLLSNDHYIKNRMRMVLNTNDFFLFVNPEEADTILITKFWGFDPWMSCGDQIVRLTSLDSALANEYQTVKDRIGKGFSIKLLAHEKALAKSA